MAAAQDGDRRSYECLLREILPVLGRFLRSRWPSAQSAEIDDIVQETLKSLHAVRHSYTPGRPFLPWLFGIARYRLLDEQRRNARRRREIEIDASDETFSGAVANTDYDRLADRDVLTQAIAQLPPGQRTAVELLKLKEMTLKEASAQTGTSVAALKVASHRALKSLRAILGNAGQ